MRDDTVTNRRVDRVDGRIVMVKSLFEILFAGLRWSRAGLGSFKALKVLIGRIAMLDSRIAMLGGRNAMVKGRIKYPLAKLRFKMAGL